jgi:hypothetical protein
LRRDWDGAQQLLNQLAAFALYSYKNIFLQPPVLFIEYTLLASSLVYTQKHLLSWAAAHRHCQTEQGLIIFFLYVTTGPESACCAGKVCFSTTYIQYSTLSHLFTTACTSWNTSYEKRLNCSQVDINLIWHLKLSQTCNLPQLNLWRQGAASHPCVN